jgi:hypothetical protein
LLDLLPANWTFHNAGLVAATGTTGVGIAATAGGSLTNAVGGSISGYSFGVSIAGHQSVGQAVSYNASAHKPIALSAGVAIGGGIVTNEASGTITSPLVGVAIAGGGSLVNAARS